LPHFNSASSSKFGHIKQHMPRNRYYSGPITDHFDGTRFRNLSGTKPRGLRALLKWQFATPSATWPKTFASPQSADTPPQMIGGDQIRVSFIGHASYLLQSHGKAVLIDPVYSHRVGPMGIAGPRRVNAPGVAFDTLPKIDAVIVTHNHYDHMDMAVLKRLSVRDRPRFITPLGNDVILRRGIGTLSGGNVDVLAMDWFDRTPLGEAIEITAVPTQHWSARGLGDRMHALWASFVIRFGNKTIYAVGDSGLGSGQIFQDVATRFPGIDLALLPIGAYEPRWFMKDQHMNPDDAVQAFEMCGAKRALGHHWGTFQLTNEAIEAPREHLAAALAQRNIPPERFVALRPGAVHTV
jgi:L-ascorbate metabolism protein UlaG (beta-lactamase superfamily)